MWKWLTLALAVCGLLAALWWWGRVSVLQHGRTRVAVVGGGWQMRYRESPMDHSGGDATLERAGTGSPVVIDDLVQGFRYMGDDCVLYSVSRGGYGPHYLAACGDRRSLPLTEPGYDDWRILPDGLQKIEWINDVKKPTVKLPWPEIKRRALQEPRR
jgi:hypothetical protein